MRIADLARRLQDWLPVRGHRFDTALARMQQELTAARAQLDAGRAEVLKNQMRVQWRLIDEMRALRPEPAQLACEICGFAGPATRFATYDSHCIFGGGRLLRRQCPECDTIFGPAKMLDLTPRELSEEYEAHYRIYSEGDSTENEVRAFHELAPRRDGVYLNYGAGAWSRSVEQLRSEGWNVLGYEPHASAAGAQHVIGSQEQLATMKFDGIFSNNVLEHFRHPVAALREMEKLLQPGACMSHATPCFQYLYEYTRFHLFFFPGRALEVLARAAHLRLERFTVDGHYMNAVLARQA